MKRILVALATSGLLVSCGGGGDSTTTASRPVGSSTDVNTSASVPVENTANTNTGAVTNTNTGSTGGTQGGGGTKTPDTIAQTDTTTDSHKPPPVVAPPVVAPPAPEPPPAANTTTTETQTPSSPTAPVVTSPGQNAEQKAAAFLRNITSPTPPSARSTQDNPDDYTDTQIHVVYAVPLGEADRSFDVSTKFTNSITVWNNWLAAQTEGRKIKFDTYQGKLDITYVALSKTDREYSSLGVGGRIAAVTSELNQVLGGLKSNKKYMVYFEGGRQYEFDYVACGDTNLGHNVIFQYLLADPKAMGSCFNGRDLAATTFVEPRYLDYIMLHELIHAEGGVSANAPNVINFHLNGDERDIMAYSGNFDGWKILDVTRANYYNPNGLPSGVYNFASSTFLTAK